METSKFLSKALGVYMVIVSLAMLLNMHYFINSINRLIHDAPLMFVTGFFTLILGVLMVLCHNIWQWSWRVIVTLFSWLILLKGLSIIIYPSYIDKYTFFLTHNISTLYAIISIEFTVGVILCYFGFKHEKPTT